MVRLLLFSALLFLVGSCTVKPKAIDYRQDTCHYCKMTVVDKIHGSEIVTDKGKAFMFDAVECMINYTQENPDEPVALYLVNHQGKPTELIDATTATYLVSENLPSPMGAFLTAFETKEEGIVAQKKYDGKLYSWEEVIAHIRRYK